MKATCLSIINFAFFFLLKVKYVHLEFYDYADDTILEIQAPIDVVIFHGQILVNKFLFNEALLISKTFQYF